MAPPVGLEPTGHGKRRRQPCHPWLHLAALLRRHKKPRARHAGQKEEGGLQPSINRKECREKSSFFLTFELKNRKKIVRKKPAAPVDDDGHSEDVNASCRKARRHRIRRRRRVSPRVSCIQWKWRKRSGCSASVCPSQRIRRLHIRKRFRTGRKSSGIFRALREMVLRIAGMPLRFLSSRKLSGPQG